MAYKKDKKIVCLLGLCLLSLCFLVICLLIMGKDDVIFNNVEEINFSRESGFYNDEFDLNISSIGGTVFYTLDGSVPTCNSMKYDGPIHISDATENENVYSNKVDISQIYIVNALNDFVMGDLSNITPQYKVDKCTVVRAVVYYGGGIYSKVKTASYFVGFNNKSGYENMNVVSIVTDPTNLFDYENGIYVTGKEFDDNILTHKEDYLASNPMDLDSNYHLRGIDSERTASCQFFDTDYDLILSQDCGIRIHGGTTRASIQKSFNLFSRKEYNGSKFFNKSFFGKDYATQKMTLSQGGNDDRCKINDYLVNCLATELNYSTMKFSPYVLFLDGEYWGVYWLTEKYDKEYLRYHYRVDPDNIIIVKNGLLEEGRESDFEDFEEMMAYCSTSDMSNQANYMETCKFIDIDSYIDYYATMILISRCGDWPVTNEEMWKTSKKGSGNYEDGKWRWMLFDVNWGAMDVENAEFDSIEYTMNESPMFANLMQNDDFKNRLLDKIIELSNTVFSCERVKKEISNFRVLMDEPMKNNNLRFYGEDAYDDYLDHIADVDKFFLKRNTFISELVEKYR